MSDVVSQFIAAFAQGFVRGIPLARELGKRFASMLADFISESVKRLVRAFWTGGIFTAVLILAGVVIVLPFVTNALPISVSARDQLDSTVYALAVAMFLLRLLVFVVRSR